MVHHCREEAELQEGGKCRGLNSEFQIPEIRIPNKPRGALIFYFGIGHSDLIRGFGIREFGITSVPGFPTSNPRDSRFPLSACITAGNTEITTIAITTY